MKVRLSDGTEKVLALGTEYKVVGTSAFASEVRSLFGGDAV